MLLDSFLKEFPDKYYKLGIKDYIQSHYKYYNVDKIEKCIYTIIFNIQKRLLADKRKKIDIKEKRYLLISRNPNFYPYKEFSYWEIINSINILKSLNIVEEIIGGREYFIANDEWHYHNSTLTKIKLNNYEDWNIDKLNLSWLNLALILFCNEIPEPKIIIRNKKIVKKRNHEGILVKRKINIDTEINPPYQWTDLNYINDFLIKKNLPQLQYSRIFGKDMKTYGRIYNSFQNIPKVFRQKILDQEGWIELDYQSCIVNILYLIETGKFYNGDIYNDILNKAKLPIEFRKILKSLFIVSINTKNKKDAIKAIRKTLVDHGLYTKLKRTESVFKGKKILLSKYFSNVLKKFNYYFNDLENFYSISPEYILSLFEEDIVLSKYLFTQTSSFTQNIESNTIIRILHELIHCKILPISIHDCFFVPIKYKDKFELLMKSFLIEECYYYKNNFLHYCSSIITIQKEKQQNLFICFLKLINVFKNIITIEIWKWEFG